MFCINLLVKKFPLRKLDFEITSEEWILIYALKLCKKIEIFQWGRVEKFAVHKNLQNCGITVESNRSNCSLFAIDFSTQRRR